ncbi:hypothetical protein BJV82DRAFT_582105 [Fennellomyces sp. T-0311]|nr:hypothetical protein BJV82DRAFT_582105 [Fennellomyces sp. T-0311]
MDTRMSIPSLLYSSDGNTTAQEAEWMNHHTCHDDNPSGAPPLPTMQSSKSCDTHNMHFELPSVTLLDDSSFKRSETLPPTFSQFGQDRQDRKQRNKVASAKYRAKRNQETANMRKAMETLMKENKVLQQQLHEANSRLHYFLTRGKIVDDHLTQQEHITAAQEKHQYLTTTYIQ